MENFFFKKILKEEVFKAILIALHFKTCLEGGSQGKVEPAGVVFPVAESTSCGDFFQQLK